MSRDHRVYAAGHKRARKNYAVTDSAYVVHQTIMLKHEEDAAILKEEARRLRAMR